MELKYYTNLKICTNLRIRDIELEGHGLPLPVSFMGKPFEVSSNCFIFFSFAKVQFLFLSVLEVIIGDHHWC